jgi:hypothetical protein
MMIGGLIGLSSSIIKSSYAQNSLNSNSNTTTITTNSNASSS